VVLYDISARLGRGERDVLLKGPGVCAFSWVLIGDIVLVGLVGVLVGKWEK